jgi:pimeloyl-ACP methyl ester carboxylesterase
VNEHSEDHVNEHSEDHVNEHSEDHVNEHSEEIWVAQSGDPQAPLLVVIHGSLDRSAGMLRLARALDSHYRVVRYDRRGYGRSRPHEGPFGLQYQVADLAKIVDGRQVQLFGHSYGGNVALAFAEQQPGQVTAVAVYETPLSWYEWWPGTTAGSNALATRGLPQDAAEAFMRRLIGDQRWEQLPERTRLDRRQEGPAMVGELSDLRQRPAWDPANIATPVLALWGEHGSPHHRKGMEFLAEQLSHGRVQMIPEAAHGAPMSHSEQLAAELISFFDLWVPAR